METVRHVKYKTIFDPKLQGILGKLPKDIRWRIRKKIDRAELNPYHYYERLEGRAEYKLRIGDYRVIADICPAKKLIGILLICHRKNVYKQLP